MSRFRPDSQSSPSCPRRREANLFRLGVLARALAFFLGGFGVLNVIGELLVPHFDANIWWIDVRFLPAGVRALFTFTASALLLAYAIRPRLAAGRKYCTLVLAVLLLAAALRNSLAFGVLLARGLINTQLPVPLSGFIAGALFFIIVAIILRLAERAPVGEPPARRRVAARARMALFPVLLLIIFPLAQMFFFGKTDYRRAADVIVVPGARVYASGECSPALADRVATACALYRAGYAARLIFSGGPGDGSIYESAGMKKLAMQLGVPAAAVSEDTSGLNTQATIDNSLALCQAHGWQQILVVSHFYHLPRLKMAFQRAGHEVFTVPAQETVIMKALPYYMAREVVALWAYYFRIPTK